MHTNKNNNYDENASKYAALDLKGTGTVYLAFRDLQYLLETFKPAGVALEDLHTLDYGCGAGRSTRYLQYLGIHTIVSVDVNQTMLDTAKKMDSSGSYQLIQSADVPATENRFDLALCSFVLVEISEKTEIYNIFNEIKRVLQLNGLLMIITLSAEFYNEHNTWLSYDQKNRGNFNLKSGEKGRFKLTQIDMEFSDYHWNDEDIRHIAKECGLEFVHCHHPLGNHDEEHTEILSMFSGHWKSETEQSPYAIYTFKKVNESP